MYVIGIDLGTQSLKGLLVDINGKIIMEANCVHDPVYPYPAWAEQVVADWIHSFKKVVHELIQKSGVAPEEIGTIGMDAINDSIVVIDHEGNPMMNSIIWLDRRAETEIKTIEKKFLQNAYLKSQV